MAPNRIWQATMCVWALVCLATALSAEPIKQLKPTGYVNDFAGVLDASSSESIRNICRQIDQKAKAQIAIVTIQSLDGAEIESYASDLYKAWGIGPKSSNRGVLILLAINDRKRRIEEAAAEHGGNDHREDNRRECEDEVGEPHQRAVGQSAEVAGDGADEAADRHRERDEHECDRKRRARAVDDAAADIAAELVRPEQVRPRGRLRRREALLERPVRRDERREDRDQDPGHRDHDAGDRERLPPRGRDVQAPVRGPRLDGDVGHVILIRGSMTPYSTSTMKLTLT